MPFSNPLGQQRLYRSSLVALVTSSSRVDSRLSQSKARSIIILFRLAAITGDSTANHRYSIGALVNAVLHIHVHTQTHTNAQIDLLTYRARRDDVRTSARTVSCRLSGLFRESSAVALAKSILGQTNECNPRPRLAF